MPSPPPDPTNDSATELQTSATEPTTSAPGPAPRPGDLTRSWRVMLGLGWLAAFFAYAGVWQASVQIGIGTWWIGPRAQPTHVAIKLIPFYLSLVMCLLIVYNVRWIVRWAAAGVAAAALISIPDFSRSVGLGIAEAVLAGLLGLITLASLSGRYRVGSPASTTDRTPESTPLDPAAH